MHTPIYEFLTRYAAQDPLRMHMPGHKGRGLGSALDAAFPLDITEIPGADSLFDAAGIIAESEANAAAGITLPVRCTALPAPPCASRLCWR